MFVPRPACTYLLGGREPSEADASSELASSAAEFQSVADAEMADALQRAAMEIGLEWIAPPHPEHSRLDNWFLGNQSMCWHSPCTNSPGKTVSSSRGFLPPATAHSASHNTPTPGTSGVTPLRPLVESFSDWLNLPNPSRWLLRTIRLGYAIQFARHPPWYRGVLITLVRGESAAVLDAEIAVLLAKDAIETVPSAEIKKGFYSPTSLYPRRRVLSWALHKLPFKILTLNHILTCVRVQDWFVAIDLKDAYFHVLILPRQAVSAVYLRRSGLSVQGFSLRALPVAQHLYEGSGSCPCPSQGSGDVVLNHLAHLGLWVNWEKSKLSPAQSILSRGHAAGPDAHETAAALASYPSPEMGMAPRHTGWDAVYNGRAASGVWTGPRLLWHINCLELLTVLLALKRFRNLVHGKHVLIRTDNTATVVYINHQGGVRSFRMSQLARHLLLWSQHRLKSLRATHIPGKFNRVADSLSRRNSLGGERERRHYVNTDVFGVSLGSPITSELKKTGVFGVSSGKRHNPEPRYVVEEQMPTGKHVRTNKAQHVTFPTPCKPDNGPPGIPGI
ncbi:ORF V: Enzymatic polyprotein [Labeo rohita]|uniref:ORF V: Enzymatic polyprotein n=1 Tax=Labeo rohita TaxID=84645 RepID=A0ABQ8LY74_LABRO|nr:ORF V: Enzymatic polyprotein [Labeo rohita]